MMILDKIHAYKLNEVAENKRLVSIESLKERCKDMPEAVKSGTALKRDNRIKFIAEVKKASPSAGIIREDFNYIDIAKEYEVGGASAISHSLPTLRLHLPTFVGVVRVIGKVPR